MHIQEGLILKKPKQQKQLFTQQALLMKSSKDTKHNSVLFTVVL